MNNNTVSFIKVSTKKVIELISSAKERIIIAKPAFLEKEIQAVLDTIDKRNLPATIYMEAGDSAIRFGFGETKALDLISKNFEKIDVHTFNKLRIAMVIIDNSAIIYMPNLAFIEDQSSELDFPNGFSCSSEVTDDIIKQFSINQNVDDENSNIIILPRGYIPLSDSNREKDEIEVSIKKLEDNPAIDPAKLKKVNFYRNNYKILKMQVCGIRINNKSLNIKPFYTLLPDINERLKSSWTIFTPADIDELQNTKFFEIELNKIKDDYNDYLFDAGRFGYIIDINKKAEFKDKIEQLKNDFKSYLGKAPDSKVIERFEGIKDNNEKNTIEPKKDLKTILQNSRTQLINFLLELCPREDEFLAKVFTEYRHLKHELNEDKSNVNIVLNVNFQEFSD